MKMMLKGFVALAMLFGLAMTGALARPVSELEKRELVQLVNDMNKAAQRKDSALIVNNMPERLYREMAVRMHASEVDLRESLKASVQAQFDQFGANGYMMNAAAIQYAQTKSGAFYALVPTRVETAGSVTEFMTLALFDNTKWHLIYGGQKTVQNPVFLEIYPDFANIAMPVPKVSRK